MFVLEAKLRGSDNQFQIIDEMVRTAGFIRNKCVRYWMDNQGIGQYDLSRLCKDLATEYEWAGKLNSMARQASAERAWQSIKRFYDNCKNPSVKKKGFPKFKKARSVEYKTSGYKLSEDRQSINFIDGFKAGTFRMIGAADLSYYQLGQIKRVRVVRRADGYYAQFCIQHERSEEIEPTEQVIALDVGLLHFYTDNRGNKVENPRHLRKSEKALKRLQRRVNHKVKGSNKRKKAVNKLGRKHLKVSRQRKDFAVKLARSVVKSSDLVVFEALRVRNLVKNHHLAKSISDAAWRMFFDWLEYYGQIFGKIVVPAPPQWSSQECSSCGQIVKKSLSTRTHICSCGANLCRDENAAKVLLARGLKIASTQGHWGINAQGQTNLCQLSENLVDKLTG
ncbi:MAG: IS200/IS605 family transposase ISAsp18 [Chroococcidiopsis cubana SAG 39.79]|nr:RNA-guided endonuclease TnpB family protein [Chroococcidiopsis cubana]MDZ4877973.1 IS200/IS605 family transposase ISAsp18 [Chroococcidiopsis cubana SAG 39.79]PSB63204.1 transposase [Chroococcidiopsis cubana CCALA 043]